MITITAGIVYVRYHQKGLSGNCSGS